MLQKSMTSAAELIPVRAYSDTHSERRSNKSIKMSETECLCGKKYGIYIIITVILLKTS